MQKQYIYHGSLTFLIAVIQFTSSAALACTIRYKFPRKGMPAKIAKNSTVFWIHSSLS